MTPGDLSMPEVVQSNADPNRADPPAESIAIGGCRVRTSDCPPSCGLPPVDGHETRHDAARSVAEDPEILRVQELVRRDRVCWEIYPMTLKVADGLRRVGFELELFGTHDPPSVPMTSDCSECRAVHDDLLGIARWLVPHESRRTRCEIEYRPGVLSFSPKRRFRGDVRMAIEVVHRDGFDQPIDECEVRCVQEMKERLRSVGARPDSW